MSKAWSQLCPSGELNQWRLQVEMSWLHAGSFFFCKQVASCVTPIMTGRSIAAPPVSPSWGDSVLGRQRAGEEKGMNVKPPTQWRRLLPFFPSLCRPRPPVGVHLLGVVGVVGGWRGLAVELHMRRQPGLTSSLHLIWVVALVHWDHHSVMLTDCQSSVVLRIYLRAFIFDLTSSFLQGCFAKSIF